MTDTEPYNPDPDTLAAIDRWLEYRVWYTRTPGAQVAIGVDGEVVFSRAYGYADLESQTPMSTGHLFRIASHSKTFTATALLQLAEQGRLGLDDPVGRYVPELADDPDYASITLRELAEHTGGVLRDGTDADFWQASRPFPDREELITLVRAGVKREPGELFAYSNLGFSLLGLVIENVTGQSYFDATRAMIIEPLGLGDTAAEYLPDRARDYAVGYSGLGTDVERHRIDHVDTAAMAAATGFTSTASDLVGYFSAHRMGEEVLLTDRSKRRQQRRTNDGDPTGRDASGYGIGMGTEKVGEHLVVGHSGGYPGHITRTLLDPESGLVVSVLTNAIDGPAGPLATGVLRLLDRAESESKDGDHEPISEAARAHTGRYRNEWSVLDLAAVGGSLLALSPTSDNPVASYDELTEEQPDRWLISEGSGYGSIAEPVTFDEDGIRYGGLSMRRFDTLPERGLPSSVATD